MHTWGEEIFTGVKSSWLSLAQVNTSIWAKNKLGNKTQNVKLSNVLLVWVCRDIQHQSKCQLWHVYARKIRGIRECHSWEIWHAYRKCFCSNTTTFGNFKQFMKNLCLALIDFLHTLLESNCNIFWIIFLSTVLAAGLEHDMSHYSAFGSQVVGFKAHSLKHNSLPKVKSFYTKLIPSLNHNCRKLWHCLAEMYGVWNFWLRLRSDTFKNFGLRLLLELQSELSELLAMSKRPYPVFTLKRLKNRIKRICWSLQYMPVASQVKD